MNTTIRIETTEATTADDLPGIVAELTLAFGQVNLVTVIRGLPTLLLWVDAAFDDPEALLPAIRILPWCKDAALDSWNGERMDLKPS